MYHTVTLCEEVADRMRSPQRVQEIMNEQQRRYGSADLFWSSETWIEGFPGIACFYAMMDRIFPDGGWAAITHEYLKITAAFVEEKGLNRPSLFTGLTGICFSLAFCSNRGERYQNILQKLEDVLTDQINVNYLQKGKEYLQANVPLPSTFYNLSDGISGILGYALLRKDNSRLYLSAVEAAQILVNLFLLPFENFSLPRWFLSPEHQLNESEREKYPKGSFILNMPFGVAGCLSALSLLAQDGMDFPGLKEVIQMMGQWLKKQCKIEKGLYYFGNTLPVEGLAEDEIPRDTWWCGIPAIAHALLKAGKAINDVSMQQFAEDAMLSMFSKRKEEWNPMGTSFVHGRAGILATTYRMAQATGNPQLWQQVKELEMDLATFYRPNSSFGFEVIYVDEFDKYHWIDNPGILYGASGIALSLMLAQNREELNWDRAFLLR